MRFLACLVPSQAGIPEYDAYAQATFELIARINASYGTPGWVPVTVLHEQNRVQALAAMELYDVLLVNSVADGLNLVSKEGPLVNRRDGSVVLSQTVGSHRELKHGALTIDPLDVAGTTAALRRALQLSPGERKERVARMRQAIRNYQLSDWLRAQLKDLEVTAHEKALSA